MQKANGRQRQNSYRFKVRFRDVAEELSAPDTESDAQSSGVNNCSQNVPTGNSAKHKSAEQTAGPSRSSTANTSSSSSAKGYRKPSQPFSKHDPLPEKLHGKNSNVPNANRQAPMPMHHQNQYASTESKSNSELDVPDKCSDYDKNPGTEWQQVQKSKNRKHMPTQHGPMSVVKLASAPKSIPSNETTTAGDCLRKENQKHSNENPVVRHKKKKPSKEERRRKREEATLTELYKPKDSHVHMLPAELFQQIKGVKAPVGISAPSSSSSISKEAREAAANFRFTSSAVQTIHKGDLSEFPTLNTFIPPKPSGKSFAAAVLSSSPLPPVTTSVSNVSQVSAHSLYRNSASTLNSAQDLQSATASNTKKPKLSKRPITISLGDLIGNTTTAPQKQSIAKKQIARKNKHDNLSAIRENPRITVGNILDSSGPVVIHRGKIREKKKKPSKLKKAILFSRETRKLSINMKFSISEYSEEPSVDLKSENNSTDVNDADDRESGDHIKSFPSSDSDIINCDLKKLKNEDLLSEERTETVYGFSAYNSIETKDNDKPETSDEGKENIFKSLMEQAEETSKSVLPIPSSIHGLVKLQMHSRKFRPYCDMFVSKELHGLVISLMKELHRLQDRIYKADPMKLQTKRRFVNGMKEVSNAVKFNKAQMIIMAPDIEPNSGQGGLDEKITEILIEAKEKNIPYIFSGNRFILGKCIKQSKSPVSVMTILDKQSVEDQFNQVLELANQLREQYQCEFNRRAQELNN